jgi:hypothetical protein
MGGHRGRRGHRPPAAPGHRAPAHVAGHGPYLECGPPTALARLHDRERRPRAARGPADEARLRRGPYDHHRPDCAAAHLRRYERRRGLHTWARCRGLDREGRVLRIPRRPRPLALHRLRPVPPGDPRHRDEGRRTREGGVLHARQPRPRRLASRPSRLVRVPGLPRPRAAGDLRGMGRHLRSQHPRPVHPDRRGARRHVLPRRHRRPEGPPARVRRGRQPGSLPGAAQRRHGSPTGDPC